MLTLLLDCHFLCHRAHHATGSLSYEGFRTGVAFGVLQEIDQLADRFGPDLTIFAFDSGGLGHRGMLDPRYKSSRRDKVYTEEEQEDRRVFLDEVFRLRSEILPSLGYRNIWLEKGFEADDLIAAAAICAEDSGNEAVIVSSDNDLWQCLRPSISFYNPITKKLITYETFKKEFGIEPAVWAQVKAICGCSSDDVIGIKGVGPKTAVAWMLGRLKPGNKKYDLINDNLDVINRNMKLVKLPFPGLELPEVKKDHATEERRFEVLQKLGIRDRRGGWSDKTTRKPVVAFEGFDV